MKRALASIPWPLLLIACASPPSESSQAAKAPQAAEAPDEGASSPRDQGGAEAGPPLSRQPSDLRELLIDLAAARMCGRMDGKLLALSGTGASGGGATEPAVGVLWVERCEASQVDPTHLRIDLAGSGWRWLSRETSRAGATFEVDQYARFEIDVGMVATADLVYEPQEHIVTAWLNPTEPVQVDLRPLGDIDVDTESLWADIVGGAASLIGKSPAARAEQRLEKKGGRRFEQKLAEGFSVAVNLCTGRRVTHLGTLRPGTMPPIPLDPKGQLQEASGRAKLHDEGLLMFGPFPGDRSLVTKVSLASEGAVRAQLMCEGDARELHQAFLNGRELPEVNALASAMFRSQQLEAMQMNAAECPVVLTMQPTDRSTPVSLEWVVYHPGAGFKPIVNCR